MSYNIHHGNNIAVLKTYPNNHFDSIISDPPYGLKFLGKDWDTFKATKVTKSQVVKNLGTGMRMTTYQENLNYQEWCSEWASECLRVLKPGGYLLSFSAARLYHHMACGIEAAGFEIRDQIMWLYGSGFPKAQDIGKAIQKRHGVEETKPQFGTNAFGKQDGKFSVGGDQFGGMTATYEQDKKDDVIPTSPEAKQWAGYKTALKPAHEPIVMARKPFKGSTIDNVLEHGVGALNIDESRIDWDPGEQEKEQVWRERYMKKNVGGPTFQETSIYEQKKGGVVEDAPQGRFPSNVIGEVEDYQKFFYCPKVSRKERHCGFEQDNVPPNKDYMVEAMGGTWVDKNMIDLPHIGKIYVHGLRDEYDKWLKKDPLAHIPAPFGQIQGAYVDGERMAKVADDTQYAAKGNDHPTVKPSSLMKYLIKLVTPPNSKVLDPFMGSGSTGMACVELGHEFTGIELDKHYCEIAEKRIEGWKKLKSTELFVEE